MISLTPTNFDTCKNTSKSLILSKEQIRLTKRELAQGKFDIGSLLRNQNQKHASFYYKLFSRG